jgi:hypothetical protein
MFSRIMLRTKSVGPVDTLSMLVSRQRRSRLLLVSFPKYFHRNRDFSILQDNISILRLIKSERLK